VIFFDAIGKIRTSKVFFCCSSDEKKDNFDVLKKMASRSSEIRRSDPLPLKTLAQVKIVINADNIDKYFFVCFYNTVGTA
jgi:hypothetical protein